MDINEYAIKLDLLLASNADAILGDVSNKLDKLRSDFATAASSMGSGLDGSAGAYAATMDQAQVAAAGMVGSTSEIVAEMEQAARTANVATSHHEAISNVLEEEARLQKASTQESQKFSQAVQKTGILLSTWHGVLTGISQTITDIGDGLKNNAKRLTDAVIGTEQLKRAFLVMLDDQEQFATVNYRFYGSQKEVLRLAAQTALEYDLVGEAAVDAYKLLAGMLREPAGELQQFAVQMTEFNFVTGVSMQVTSDWIRRMRLIGYSAADSERQLGFFTHMMRGLGLSIQQVTFLLQEQTDRAAQYSLAFGKEGVEQLSEFQSYLMGVANQAGLSDNAMRGLMSTLFSNDMMSLMRMRGFGEDYLRRLGVDPDQLKGAERDLQLRFAGLLGMMQEVEQAVTGLAPEERAAVVQQMLGQFGLQMTLQEYEQFRKMIVDEKIQTAEDLKRVALKINPELANQIALNEEYTTRMDNIYRTWRMIWSDIEMAWEKIFILIEPAVLAVLKIFQGVVDQFTDWINVLTEGQNPITDFAAALEGLHKPAERILNFLKEVGKGFQLWLAPMFEGLDFKFDPTMFEGWLSFLDQIKAEDVRDWLDSTWNSIKSFFSDIPGNILKLMPDFGSIFGGMFEMASDLLPDDLSGMFTNFFDLIVKGARLFKDVWVGAWNLAKQAIGPMQTIFGWMKTGIESMIGGANTLTDAVTPLANAFAEEGLAGVLRYTLGPNLSALYDMLVSVTQWISNNLFGAIGSFSELLSTGFSAALNAVIGIFGLWNSSTESASGWLQSMWDRVTGLMAAVGTDGLMGALQATASYISGGFITAIKDAFSILGGEAVLGWIDKLAGLASWFTGSDNLANPIEESTKSITSNVADLTATGPVIEAAYNRITEIMATGIEQLKSQTSALMEAAAPVISTETKKTVNAETLNNVKILPPTKDRSNEKYQQEQLREIKGITDKISALMVASEQPGNPLHVIVDLLRQHIIQQSGQQSLLGTQMTNWG